MPVGRGPSRARDAEEGVALASLTWPEVERLCASAPRTAVLPLGSTEQHGPHLACGTDTLIADALGARLCARLPEAILLPTLPVGCASEHLDFPGTLHVGAETLAAVLANLLVSLRRQGFARAFVFSAHGGNCAPLAEALPALREAASPMAVAAFTDLDRLSALWHEQSAAFGIAADASGHHAGEFETSIVRALRPSAVRPSALAAGRLAGAADAQGLFYPSLRAQAPSGTVGDPRGADAARGLVYLDAWADLLLTAYRREKKSA
jgi:creatinine amidohydrolase